MRDGERMTTYEEWQASVERQWAAEIEHERAAVALMKRRAIAFAEAVAAYPHAWDWGDGYGGAVTELIIKELRLHGFERTPPTYPNAKPNRPSMSATRRVEVFERDGFKCVRCGTTKGLTVDHIQPVSKGGTNDDENLQTLCRSCNTSKGAKV